MKETILAAAVFCAVQAGAQQNAVYQSRFQKFDLAKEYYQKGQYSLAYPLMRELKQDLREADRTNNALQAEEINYYATVLALKQNNQSAAYDARQFIDVAENKARVSMMNFHLAEYLFRQGEYSDAVALYEGADISNLDNREIADLKFHQGYSYFTLQQFAQAKPLLNAIRQLPKDPNYVDANYYYGFIAFRDRNYTEALQAFKTVENEPLYESLVPYYIAQIYYVQGRKEEALKYAEAKIKSGTAQKYDTELKQMLGHAYFEKREYAKALPYLEDYVAKAPKVRREDLYELSYAYYKVPNYNKAIDGFKQLSGKEDSLSQHAMYLLGDSYLKTGQKSAARNAFLFSAANSSNGEQKEIAKFNYAKLSYELGFQDEALKSLRTFLTEYPSSQYADEATELLVGALTGTNNYREALRLLESLPNATQATRRMLPRILLGRATEMINDGQLAEAEALLDRGLKDPNNASVAPLLRFWKGELAYRAGRVDEAIQHWYAYQEAGSPTAGEANDRNVKYNLGYAYHRKENYAVSRTFFEPLSRNASLSSDPITQDAYVRTADAFFMAKNYATARSMYDNVIKFSWPSEDYATYQKAIISGIGSSAEKISGLNTLIRKFPSSFLVGDANMEIANTYLADERFRDALPYLNNIIKNNSYTALKPQAYLKAGIAYYNLNNTDEAIGQLNKVIELYPDAPEAEDALDNLKTIYVEKGRTAEYADAARRAGKPLSVNAEDSLSFQAAELQYQNGNANALASLESYLQRFPNGGNAVDAHFYVAEIHSARKAWDNALLHYSAVIERSPNPFAERSLLAAARINFFEKKDYAAAEALFAQLKSLTANGETRLESMRGLLRSQYQQQKWTAASENAKELVAQKGSTADDKSLGNMVIGKSAQSSGQYDQALAAFKNVIAVNKGVLAAEARYEIAASWFALARFKDAENAAFEVINKSGSYEWWVTKSYILLGDIYLKQKDYFNAKATYQSVVENSLNTELKGEAQRKLDAATAEESQNSKINNR